MAKVFGIIFDSWLIAWNHAEDTVFDASIKKAFKEESGLMGWIYLI